MAIEKKRKRLDCQEEATATFQTRDTGPLIWEAVGVGAGRVDIASAHSTGVFFAQK